MRLVCGLDLGQSADHSALAAVERVRLTTPVFRRRFRYVVRVLEEYPLGTSYPDQVKRFVAALNHPALRKSAVGVDYTGVGRPVFDMLRQARPPVTLYPVLTTAGNRATIDDDTREVHVPKVDQVSLLQVLMHADLIHWHPKLPTAERLKFQLAKYTARIKTSPLRKKKSETFGAEAGANDDLVSAIMTACWLGEHVGTGDISGVTVPGAGDAKGGSVTDTAPEGVFLQ
jgi:hypothetical protein